jgi:hypothetical protein
MQHKVLYCIEPIIFGEFAINNENQAYTIIKIQEDDLDKYDGTLLVTEKYLLSNRATILDKWKGMLSITDFSSGEN